MSKAFTRETDAKDDDLPEADFGLPLAAKYYMTPQGHEELGVELKTLRNVERPKFVEVVSWAVVNGDRSENGDYIYGKKRLREIDQRIRFLLKRLDNAEIVDPGRQKGLEKVFFGAIVTYETSAGLENTFRSVGVDEAQMGKGQVSWISPIARALHKAHEGDVVQLRTPAGIEEIEVVKIAY